MNEIDLVRLQSTESASWRLEVSLRQIGSSGGRTFQHWRGLQMTDKAVSFLSWEEFQLTL